MSYEDAVKSAIKEIEENQVISRWNDKGDGVWEKIGQKEISKAIFIDRKEEDISNIEPSKVYQSFIGIGGENGWF